MPPGTLKVLPPDGRCTARAVAKPRRGPLGAGCVNLSLEPHDLLLRARNRGVRTVGTSIFRGLESAIHFLADSKYGFAPLAWSVTSTTRVISGTDSRIETSIPWLRV